jgi:proteasome lid subunit RPN8/RPN11
MSAAAGEAIRVHASRCYPEECCGALFGDGCRIESAMALNNAAENKSRHFAVTAGDYLKATRKADRQGCQLLGFYHSHIDAAAIPSAQDLGSAGDYPLMVIVGVWGGVADPPRVYCSPASFVEV